MGRKVPVPGKPHIQFESYWMGQVAHVRTDRSWFDSKMSDRELAVHDWLRKRRARLITKTPA